MGVCSVDLDAMAALVECLDQARARADADVREVSWRMRDVLLEPPKSLLRFAWEGEGSWMVEQLRVDCRRRLELSRQIAADRPKLRVVSVDAGFLDLAAKMPVWFDYDSKAVSAAVKNGDLSDLRELLGKYRVTGVAEDGSSYTYYDPEFGKWLAKSLSPYSLAVLLQGLNAGGEATDYASYDQLLWDLAGLLSAGARMMTEGELEQFAREWSDPLLWGFFPPGNPLPGPSPGWPTGTPSGSPSGTPSGSPSGQGPTNQPTMVPGLYPQPASAELPPFAGFEGLPIQLLSLVVARGDWPDHFLDVLFDQVVAHEPTGGWAKADRVVWDPGAIDQQTGRPVVVQDPMWGVLNAAVNNPDWFINRFTPTEGEGRDMSQPVPSGEPAWSEPGSPPPPLPPSAESVVVSEEFYGLFTRGFDQASLTALVGAVTAADLRLAINGQDPRFLVQLKLVSDELARTNAVSGFAHGLLDALSMIPVVGEAADLVNAVVYWLEGEATNGALCMASVFLPSVTGLAVLAPRWMATGVKVAESVDEAVTVAKGADNLPRLTTPTTPGHYPGRVPPSRPAYGEMDDGPGAWLSLNRGSSGMGYQAQVSGVPKADDGSIMEYYLPWTKSDGELSQLSFDGHVWRGQPPEEIYLEAKDGYNFPIVNRPWPDAATRQLVEWEDEAKRQLEAMEQAGVVNEARLEWHFSDEKVADFMRRHFKENGYNITVIYTPKR